MNLDNPAMAKLFKSNPQTLDFEPGVFPLVIMNLEPQNEVSLHSHRFCELVFILSGSGKHTNSDDAYDLAPGDVFVVSGNHGYAQTQDLRLINVLFDPERLALPLTEARRLPGWQAFFAIEPALRREHRFRSRLHLDPAKLSQATSIIADIDAELHSKRSGASFVAIAHLMRLIDFLAQAYSNQTHTDSVQVRRLGEVLGWMEEDFAKPLLLSQLAQRAHLSERQFLRVFRAACGTSPMDWLIRRRLAAATAHLSRGASVTVTASVTGFRDPAYFSRQFRKIFGVAPGTYRKSAGKTVKN